jgi:uncharacterized protein YjbI with pentapeptide repeats
MPRVLKATPATVAFFPSGVDSSQDSMTCLVKLTLDLAPGAIGTLAEPQLFPTGDEPHGPADEDVEASARYASDFAPHKPRADVLLVGHCHVPGGEPVTRCQAGLRVGSVERRLTVLGDRRWERHGLRKRPSEPEPFTSMKLTYERAFGGPHYELNPVGCGHKPDDEHPSLPNIEVPLDTLESTRDRPPPAGFGPLGAMWKQRRRKLGSYKGDWLKTRWPHWPKDFDWGHFNAAPPEQQVEGYLRGDEEIVLENLHPEHAEYRTRLPGLRQRVFVEEDDDSFREVPMQLDTLWIDADAEQAVLVWRGHTPVRSDEFDEVRHVLFLQESLADEPASLEDSRAAMHAAIAEEDAKYAPPPAAPEPDAPPAPEPEPEPPPAEPEDPLAEFPELRKLRDKAEAELQARGFDPENPPIPTPEEKATAIKVLTEAGVDPAVIALIKSAGEPEPEEPEVAEAPQEPAVEWTRERVAEAGARGASMEGADLAGLDLSGLDLRGALLGDAKLVGTNLEKADLRGAVLSGTDLSGAVLSGAQLGDADFEGATLVKANLEAAQCEGTVFAGATLTEANLAGLAGAGSAFVDASMEHAVLTNADLSTANLAGANLADADLSGATLVRASLQRVQAPRARLAGADLTELRASQGADFSGCVLSETQGAHTNWEEATLVDADLRGARLERAHFPKACLDRADASGADLKGASFRKASLREATLARVNLFEGSFEQADLTDADLRGSNAYGVEFLNAVLDGARRDGLNVKATKLEGT